MRTAWVIDPRTWYMIGTQSANWVSQQLWTFFLHYVFFLSQETESHCNSERPIAKPALLSLVQSAVHHPQPEGFFLWGDPLYQVPLPMGHHTFVNTLVGTFSKCLGILKQLSQEKHIAPMTVPLSHIPHSKPAGSFWMCFQTPVLEEVGGYISMHLNVDSQQYSIAHIDE